MFSSRILLLILTSLLITSCGTYQPSHQLSFLKIGDSIENIKEQKIGQPPIYFFLGSIDTEDYYAINQRYTEILKHGGIIVSGTQVKSMLSSDEIDTIRDIVYFKALELRRTEIKKREETLRRTQEDHARQQFFQQQKKRDKRLALEHKINKEQVEYNRTKNIKPIMNTNF